MAKARHPFFYSLQTLSAFLSTQEKKRVLHADAIPVPVQLLETE
jgi:hypothetical protein